MSSHLCHEFQLSTDQFLINARVSEIKDNSLDPGSEMEKHIFDVKRKKSCLKLTLDETKNDMHVEFTSKRIYRISLQGLDELRFFFQAYLTSC